MFDSNAICADISASIASPFVLASDRAVGGGDINETYLLLGQCGRKFFLKLNRVSKLDMFIAEAEGLLELDKAKVIRTPKPVCYGETHQHAYLVMEHIHISSGSVAAETLFGQQLAHLHQFDSKGRGYGWHRDNTIGVTPQLNNWSQDWLSFLAEQRLGYQLELAASKGASRDLLNKGDELLKGLGFYFESYDPEPSLLHGDLWSGNYCFDENDSAVIFDPAVYYGDRESDIAMTELFGGFSARFYSAYEQVWPLDPGYSRRRDIYKLYHILNHFNMFGGGYASQAGNILDKLLIYMP